LEIGEAVRLQPTQPRSPWRQGSCVAKIGPRSYLVETNDGHLYRRNRKFIRSENVNHTPSVEKTSLYNPTLDLNSELVAPTAVDQAVDQYPAANHRKINTEISPISPIKTTTRSGRVNVTPERFRVFVK
jgi:hypothetical protein